MLFSEKKTICQRVYLAVTDHERVRMKENKTISKNLDLAWELKKLCVMKVKMILIVIGAFVVVSKCMEDRSKDLEIRGRIDTILNTALLRLLEYSEASYRP